MSSNQTQLEPTCLALLAQLDHGPAVAKGMRFLISAQRHDGGWPAFAGDEEGSGLTGLAIMALNRLGGSEISVQRGVAWLLSLKGRESHWIWRWKFRTTDTRVQFDPSKVAWPWEPGTCSWVVPTAFSLLALKQSSPCWRRGRAKERVARGAQMLYDRACPHGGWNAGNGVVYEVPMPAHLDATAIGLLALRSEPPNEILIRSLTWLEREAESCAAPWSLAWSILALDAYHKPAGTLQQRLASMVETVQRSDTATLAVAVLALDCAKTGNVFEISA